MGLEVKTGSGYPISPWPSLDNPLTMAGGLLRKNRHKLSMTTVRVTPESNADDALAVTQVLCKLMLQASLIAIPAYLGLFMVAVPFDINAGVERGLILATPVIEFVVAALFYAIAFLVTLSESDRENLEISSRIRNRAIRRKMRFMFVGSASLLLGVFSGTILLLKAHL